MSVFYQKSCEKAVGQTLLAGTLLRQSSTTHGGRGPFSDSLQADPPPNGKGGRQTFPGFSLSLPPSLPDCQYIGLGRGTFPLFIPHPHRAASSTAKQRPIKKERLWFIYR